MENIFKRIIGKGMLLWGQSNSNRFVTYIRNRGVNIGKNCIFREPKTARIDLTRPYLISIGDNVDMNRFFQIWTHDWASGVFIRKYGQMINSSGKVTIGNNIYFGTSVTILKGVTIGDNCVIGACSVVTKDIPSNSVAVGNPCKVICSLDEYFEKRKRKSLSEAVETVNCYIERKGKSPKTKDLLEEYIFYKNDIHECKNQLCVFKDEREFIDYCVENKCVSERIIS